MAKIMLHDEQAREALGRGVAKLARAVRGTLGPRGMNAIIDRPMGTPIISRDGVSIAAEIELEDPFENMGAQILREVSAQTNAIAGDGTTTATVLADALVQLGLGHLARGTTNAVQLVQGLEAASEAVIAALRRAARPLRGADELRAVATIAANDAGLGALVAEAVEKAGPGGIVTVEFGSTVETTLELRDGMNFDRGYLSHHMVTDVERMQVVLENPAILMTDQKLTSLDEVAAIQRLLAGSGRPLLIIAEEVAPACVVALLADRDGGTPPIAAIHPPDYGHWRKQMLEDLAVLTGGRVIARDLGGRLIDATARDLGHAQRVRISNDTTVVSGGAGDPAAVAARRTQIRRQIELAPNNVDRDKLEQRLARLSGGTANILVGGATPVAQRRLAQLIDDAVNAARGASEEGVVPGGGTALVQSAGELGQVAAGLDDGPRHGVDLMAAALTRPLAAIASNAGLDAEKAVRSVAAAAHGMGIDARTGRLVDLSAAGIVDPVRATISAVRNATSVASLILTTHTLIASKPDIGDPTAGPALGGGAERLGRA